MSCSEEEKTHFKVNPPRQRGQWQAFIYHMHGDTESVRSILLLLIHALLSCHLLARE